MRYRKNITPPDSWQIFTYLNVNRRFWENPQVRGVKMLHPWSQRSASDVPWSPPPHPPLRGLPSQNLILYAAMWPFCNLPLHILSSLKLQYISLYYIRKNNNSNNRQTALIWVFYMFRISYLTRLRDVLIFKLI